MPALLAPTAKAVCECPHCRRVLQIRLDFAGRLAACRGCRSRFRVPPKDELIDFSASELISRGVDAEFRTRSRRTADVAKRFQRSARLEASPELEDPFSALGNR